ncbi:kinase-like domain-containing protein [Hyaloraphidium curvatum]|nr:kinase-like domain-containing protein [Hyaloraphidium curvatum]
MATPGKQPTSSDHVVGQGAEGTVFRDTFGGRPAAIKVHARRANFHREIWVLSAVNARGGHRNVIHMLDYDEKSMRIVLPLMRYSAAKRLESGPILGADLKAIVEGVLRGLIALHAAVFTHCDIKPGNILLDFRGRPVICDFGFAQRIGQPVLGGTVGYRPKEVLRGAAAHPSADLFAFGITLLVLAGLEPVGFSDRYIFEASIADGNRPLIPFGAPRGVCQVAGMCFLDAGMRPTAADLLSFLESLPASEF